MHFNSFTVTLNGFPPVVPSNPDKVYKNKGWVNRGDVLGPHTEYSKDLLPFHKAIEIVREVN
jgi:hypothetical protein